VSFVRRFILPVIATLILATASPAAAVPADWTVTPGGNFAAGGGDVVMEVAETGLLAHCVALELHGVARAGTGGNPVAIFPESPGAAFTGCTAPAMAPAIRQIGDWEMHAESYDPVSDTLAGTIRNVAFDWSSPACIATLGGSLNYHYDNSSGQLVILPDVTLTVTYVSPFDDCLGLLQEGETLSFDNTSSAVPPQQIVPA
jgi:hypothetical protein